MERIKDAFQSLPMPSMAAAPPPEEQTFTDKVLDGMTYNLYSVIYANAKAATFCPMDISITVLIVFTIILSRFIYLVFAYVFNFLVWFVYTIIVMGPSLIILLLLIIVGIVIYYFSEAVRSIANIVVVPIWNIIVEGLAGLSGILSILVGVVLMIPKIIGINIENPLKPFGPELFTITDGLPSLGEFFVMIGVKVVQPVVEATLTSMIYES
jgi:hypothetical protein